VELEVRSLKIKSANHTIGQIRSLRDPSGRTVRPGQIDCSTADTKHLRTTTNCGVQPRPAQGICCRAPLPL
jgi:hypothetical protein